MNLHERTEDCEVCQGTGIGQYGPPDVSKCHVCKGRGFFYIDDEEDYYHYFEDLEEEEDE